MMEDDLYQVILQTSNSSWKRFQLPFHLFTLTSRGSISIEQRMLDNLKLKSVGILCTIPNEHIVIDIASIKAVNEIDDTLVLHTRKDSVTLSDEELDVLYPGRFIIYLLEINCYNYNNAL